MRLRNKTRWANVSVFVAFSLIGLIGCVAIVIDGGLLIHTQRYVQSTADVAALSGAENLYYNYVAYQGKDHANAALNAAKQVAADNGFTDGNGCTVEVNIPPKNGLFVGQNGYIEVIITYQQPRGFSNIFGTGAIPVKARAVALGAWVPANVGILMLDPTSSGSLTDNGGGTVNVSGVPVIVDSNSPTAMVTVGGGNITAPTFDVTGIPGYSGSGFNGTMNSGATPTPDPLRYIPEPDPTGAPVQATKNNGYHISGGNKTIQPGVYSGGITVTGQASLTMQPGIYYMEGGGFSFSAGGNLTATGVMIVNMPSSNTDNVSIAGSPGASINISPMTTGPYAGISVWQTRTATNTVSITGNGSSTISGTFYAQHGTMKVTGGGGSDVLGAQYISWDMTIGGNGGFNLNWNPNLVARIRKLYLVE